ncbi:MAG: zinc-binding dehydrogenase [Candidatus Fimadaptatus sp.]
MKAGIYLGKESIEIRELPLPEIGDRDVLVRNICSSICGTDVAVFLHGPNTGHRVDVGGEFGHETVSRVVGVGRDVTEFRVGERVYPYPLYARDDTRRAGTIGGFSEYMLIPNARRFHSLYSVDERISDRLASLTEPFTVGCRAARRGMAPSGGGRYVEGQSAVVFGCGTIGIAAAVAFCHFGMDRVMVCDRSDFRLRLAGGLGLATCNPAREDFEEKARQFFGTAHGLGGLTADIDCWLDAAGAESILGDFLRLGKIESRFVSVAVNNAPRAVDLLRMTYAQQSIIGSGGYMPEDVSDVQRIMTCGRWDLESIITHEFPLEELETAIRTAADVQSAGNVLITMRP